MKPGVNSIPVYATMFEDGYKMRANCSDVEDKVVYLRSLLKLPDGYGYNVFRPMIEQERENLTIDRLLTDVRARRDFLKAGETV